MSSATVTYGDGAGILSSVILIAQSDIRNTENVMSWLKEQLLFE